MHKLNHEHMKKLTLFIAIAITCFSVKAQYSQDVILSSILKTDTTSIGQKIIFPQNNNNEISIIKVTIPPGKSTGWHKHSNPVFAYVISGTLTVELEGDKKLTFSANTSFAEVINTYHNGTNLGKEEVVLIAFFMGEKGKLLSEHK